MRKRISILLSIIQIIVCIRSMPVYVNSAEFDENFPDHKLVWGNRDSVSGAAIVNWYDGLSDTYSDIDISSSSSYWNKLAYGRRRVTFNEVSNINMFVIEHRVAMDNDDWDKYTSTPNYTYAVTILKRYLKGGEDTALFNVGFDNYGGYITYPDPDDWSWFHLDKFGTEIEGAIIIYPPPTYTSNVFVQADTTLRNKVIMHEIGHALGFGHPDKASYSNASDIESIMVSVNNDRQKHYLTVYDDNELRKKYPHPDEINNASFNNRPFLTSISHNHVKNTLTWEPLDGSDYYRIGRTIYDPYTNTVEDEVFDTANDSTQWDDTNAPISKHLTYLYSVSGVKVNPNAAPTVSAATIGRIFGTPKPLIQTGVPLNQNQIAATFSWERYYSATHYELYYSAEYNSPKILVDVIAQEPNTSVYNYTKTIDIHNPGYYSMRVFISSGVLGNGRGDEEDEDYVEAYSSFSDPVRGDGGSIPGITITGTNGDDLLVGTYGDDIIYGMGGNDIIIGGSGDDLLYGHNTYTNVNYYSGNETFIFEPGYGNDSVFCISAHNVTWTLKYTGGLTINDFLAEPFGSNDVILINKLTGETTKLLSFRVNPNYRRYVMEFDNGSIIDLNGSDSPLRVLHGTDDDDTLNAWTTEEHIITVYGYDGNDIINGSSFVDVIYGGAGNDTINGGAGNDILYGEEGDDTIFGGAGNDIIIGGSGDDLLYGHSTYTNVNYYSGNETFIFEPGYGNDSVFCISAHNVIWMLIYTGVSNPTQFEITPSGNNIILTNLATSEQTTLLNFRTNINYRRYIVELSNGSQYAILWENNDYYLEPVGRGFSYGDDEPDDDDEVDEPDEPDEPETVTDSEDNDITDISADDSNGESDDDDDDDDGVNDDDNSIVPDVSNDDDGDNDTGSVDDIPYDDLDDANNSAPTDA